MKIVLSLKIQQNFKQMYLKIKKNLKISKKINFENSSFRFESHLFSEENFAQTHTVGFSTNFHLKPEIRTNNWIDDSGYWWNNEQGRI